MKRDEKKPERVSASEHCFSRGEILRRGLERAVQRGHHLKAGAGRLGLDRRLQGRGR